MIAATASSGAAQHSKCSDSVRVTVCVSVRGLCLGDGQGAIRKSVDRTWFCFPPFYSTTPCKSNELLS